MISKTGLFLIATVLAGSRGLLSGQTDTGSPVGRIQDGLTPSADLVSKQNAIASTKLLMRQGSVAAAEEQLAAMSSLTPRTLGWYREMSRRLLLVAGDLTREGSADASAASITRAIAHLQSANRLAQNDVERSLISAQIGWIYDRLLADLPKALEYYQLASTQNPKSEPIRERVTFISLRLQTSALRSEGGLK